MSETRRILDMLQEGKITAQEAERLLQTVDEPEAPLQPAMTPTPPPALIKHFQTAFQIAFGVSLAAVAATGYWLYALYCSADNRITWGLVGVMLLFGCALLLAGLALWLWQARWLHVRMGEENGKRFFISLPIPLLITEWGLRIAHRFVDEQTAEYLDIASGFVQMVRHSKRELGGELMSVEIGEENQDVQVYIG
ncbi:MAG: hypothetical protein JW934_05110 [Anaerolineae bacterium]|nr:hypothetical protein [Anaerolineae bacterium]